MTKLSMQAEHEIIRKERTRCLAHAQEPGPSSEHSEEDYWCPPENPKRPPVETNVHVSGTFEYFNDFWDDDNYPIEI